MKTIFNKIFLHIIYLFLLSCLILGKVDQVHGQINKYNLAGNKSSTTDIFSLGIKNTDSSMLIANEKLVVAIKNNDKKVIANAYSVVGKLYISKGQLDSSIIVFKKAENIYANIESFIDIANAWINLAEVYSRQFKIDKALQYLIKADSLSNVLGNTSLQTAVKLYLGIVYKNNEDYPKAASYFKDAMVAYKQQEDFNGYVDAGRSMGMAYRLLLKYDSSLNILHQCLSVFTKMQLNDMRLYALIHENIGDTYLDMFQYNKALSHFTIALNQFTKFNSTIDIAYEEYSIGRTLAEMKRYREAEIHLFQSYKVNDSLKNYKYLVWISNALATMYGTEGNWKSAYTYLEKRTEWRDSIDIVNQIEKTNELKEKFESEKKEHEIVLLKTKNQLSETDNKRTRLLQYIFILLFLAAVIIGWLLTNRIKIKRKLDQQLLRNRIAGDLHDDIGSTLSSIDISSRIALLKKDDPIVVSEQLSKIRHQARKTMDSMSDIVWSINPGNDNLESMLARMQEFASEICEPQEIELIFQTAPQNTNILLNADIRKNIFMIFKEAVNNAMKYSRCSKLEIDFSLAEKNSLKVVIKDNGKGFDKITVKKGNGLVNMDARAAQINARFQISSKLGEGTVVELNCPI